MCSRFREIIHVVPKLKWATRKKHAGLLGTTVGLEMDLKEKNMFM